ncbi:hypothetical protein [Ectothiorhodospira lacustris]|uniref:hypothetical protein n=1 Tax=Ectothiorhodospira lacustris TaxID=2899127 RepID=UPI001EE874EE|nr:hypothetical protein [Ectothiorhodospira lacustris]MCG5500999.1 hypothetical protein [Ectothiorhodospira lacustris]MCG5510551.1 hypothetical protein [Ectothiorhodospira lacustris]MCG5521243.1 hypothetical protein [Ectothiorhodospira lacustris]
MARWLSWLLIPVMLGLGYLAGEHWLRPLVAPVDPATTVIQAPAGCELDARGCLMPVNGVEIRVRGPERIPPLERFALRLEGSTSLEPLEVSYIMTGMDMGLHRFEFEPEGSGHWLAESVLPVCMSGRMDWLARVRVRVDGRLYELHVPVLLRRE